MTIALASCTESWTSAEKTVYLQQCKDGFDDGYLARTGMDPDAGLVMEWCECHLNKVMKKYSFDDITDSNATSKVSEDLGEFREKCMEKMDLHNELERRSAVKK